jgi:MFS family permease
MLVIGLGFSLAFIPTFEGILDAVIEEGCPDDVITYSLVSGWWTSVENLGEVIGSSLGGVLIDYFDFDVGTNIIAAWCLFSLLIVGLHYCITMIWSKNKLKKFRSISEIDETSYLIRSNFFKRKRSTFKDILKWTLEESENGSSHASDDHDPMFRRSAGYTKVDNENDESYYLTI